MKRMVTVMAVILLCGITEAQSPEEIEAVLKVMGLASMEEADADEVDRLTDMIRHPVVISFEGIARLEEGGLLSPYQTVSLKDYIARHGKVMSLPELSAIDGFTGHYAELLKPFIRFDDRSAQTNDRHGGGRIRSDMDMKASLKLTEDGGTGWSYASRFRSDIRGVCAVGLAFSRPNDAKACYPSIYSASLSFVHRYGKVIIGDFNARFGQGLCLWNTAVFSSLTVPSSFMRRPSGLSSSYSYTGTSALTGIGADAVLGMWRVSASLAAPEIKTGLSGRLALQPSVNVTRCFSFGHISTTHHMHISDIFDNDFRIPHLKSSIDAALCFNGVNCFAETAYDWVASVASVVAGAESGLGENMSMACLVRYIPSSDEHGAAMAGEFSMKNHEGVFSLDLMHDPRNSEELRRIQLKGQLKWRWSIMGCLYAEFRVTERLRTWGLKSRTDIRADFSYEHGSWVASVRGNVLAADGIGMLGYAEGGYKVRENLKIYIRQGVFRVDDWDDRIYVYERDAPGNFNVPAFYGRGVWGSFYVAARFARWGSAYLRASYTTYPLMHENKKPGKAELKFQLTLHL